MYVYIYTLVQTILTHCYFENYKVEKVYNFERVIYNVDAVELSGGEVCYLLIHGQAFLWHQIRCIAHVLFMIGRGQEEPSIVTELLNVKKHPGKPAYQLAEDKPLVLHDCGYPNLQIGYSVQNIWMVSCQLEQQWEELMLAATRIRNCLDSFQQIDVNKQDLIEFVTTKLSERRKKQQRISGTIMDNTPITFKVPEDKDNDDKPTVSWNKVLPWLMELGLVAEPLSLNQHLHIPLLKRSKGTTYEQKLEALQKNDKKRKKYQEGVVRKRQSTEEDAKFYAHMAQQGGSGI